MRSVSRTPATLLLAGLILAPAGVSAQLSIGASGGRVAYDGIPAAATFAISPELRLERPRFVFDLNGTAATASDGSRDVSGGPALWAATRPFLGPLQLDADAIAEYSSFRDNPASSALLGLAELACVTPAFGFAAGAGAGNGSINGLTSVTSLRTRARGWLSAGNLLVSAAVEPTRMAGAWFTDYTGHVGLTAGRVEASVSGELRHAGSAATTAGEGDLSIHLNHRLSLEGSGGSYLRDPYQGLPAGRFVTLGLSVQLWAPKGEGSAGEAANADDLADAGLFESGVQAGSTGAVNATIPRLPVSGTTGGAAIGTGTGTGTTAIPGSGRSHRP
jgi:hypothetical protein